MDTDYKSASYILMYKITYSNASTYFINHDFVLWFNVNKSDKISSNLF